MNDLIERQAAIEAIQAQIIARLYWLSDSSLERKGLDAALCTLLDLPSAQPERWIPVKERLPGDGQWCLVTDGKRVSVERYKVDIIDHFWPSPRWFNVDKMVAWMPLPEPYNLGGDAE